MNSEEIRNSKTDDLVTWDNEERMRRIFFLAILMFVGFTYPLASIPPLLFDATYEIKIPSQAVLSLMAIAIIPTFRRLPKRRTMVLAAVVVFSLFLHVIFRKKHLIDALNLAGMVFIPLAIAASVKISSWMTFPTLSLLGFVLWSYQVFYTVWTRVAPQIFATGRGNEVTGFAGNRNWMAALILYLSIWAFAWVNHYFFLRFRWRTWKRWALCLILIGIPSVWVLSLCASRGVWLAFGIISFIAVLTRMYQYHSALGNRLVIYACVLSFAMVTSMMILKPSELVHAVRKDIRLPLWKSSLDLILDHPLGVGPGEFRRYLVEYLARSTYHERSVAASVTIHPHNELLHVSAQLGVPAGVCWLLLWFPVFSGIQSRKPFYQYGAYSSLAIAIPALFDMPLAMAPTSFLGLFSLGICWSISSSKIALPTPKRRNSTIKRRYPKVILFTIALVFSAFIIVKEIQKTSLTRIGMIAYRKGKMMKSLEYWRRLINKNPNDLYAKFMAAHIISYEANSQTTLREGYEYGLQILKHDRNYAHSNAIMARLMIKLGMNDQHIRELLLRECRLYPQSIQGYQFLFRYLFLTNRFQPLPVIKRHLEEIWLNQVKMQVGDEDNITRRISQWRKLVEAEEAEAAINRANAFLSPAKSSVLDPALADLIEHIQQGPKTFTGEFGHSDYRYWQEKILYRNIIEESRLHETKNHDNITFGFPEQLFYFLTENIAIDQKFTKYESPSKIWTQRSGSLLSLYCLYGFLARECGMNYRIWFSKDHQPIGADLVDYESFYSIDFNQKTFQKIKSPSKNASMRFFIPIQLHEFILRNRILSLVLRDYLSDEYIRLSDFPSIQIARDLRAFGLKKIATDDFSEFVLCPELNLYLDKPASAAKPQPN